MKVKLLKTPGGSNLVDQGRSATRTRPMMSGGELPRPVANAGREATVKACGVAVAMSQGHSWAPTLLNGHEVNVGTVRPVPRKPALRRPRGKARCRLMPAGRGARTRSSFEIGKAESHGEGVQRVRGRRVERGGRW